MTIPNHAHVCVARMKMFVYWFYSHAQWKFIYGLQMHTLKFVQQFPIVRSPHSIFIVISFRSLRIVYGNPRNSIAQNLLRILLRFALRWGSLNETMILFCLNIWFHYIIIGFDHFTACVLLVRQTHHLLIVFFLAFKSLDIAEHGLRFCFEYLHKVKRKLIKLPILIIKIQSNQSEPHERILFDLSPT